MHCKIHTESSTMVLEPERNSYLITLFPTDIELPAEFFQYENGELFVWENDCWKNLSVYEFLHELTLFDIYSFSDIENIKYIILEAIKWFEFWD